MEKVKRSLRFMVEKWLMTVPSQSVRVKRGSRARSNQRRYVYVEVLQLADSFAIYLSVMATVHGMCSRLMPNARQ